MEQELCQQQSLLLLRLQHPSPVLAGALLGPVSRNGCLQQKAQCWAWGGGCCVHTPMGYGTQQHCPSPTCSMCIAVLGVWERR